MDKFVAGARLEAALAVDAHLLELEAWALAKAEVVHGDELQDAAKEALLLVRGGAASRPRLGCPNGVHVNGVPTHPPSGVQCRTFRSGGIPNVKVLLFADPTVVLLSLFNTSTAPNVHQLYPGKYS
jgi:hypothetical protein